MDNSITKLNVDIKNNSYDIFIGNDIIKNIYNDLSKYNKILVVTDEKVPTEYANELTKQIKDKTKIITIPCGEKNKNIENVEKICSLLKENNFTRKDLVIGLGGGLVGDVSAFSASIYMRGIDFINIPTTLLSMVDSSIGGKTGVNFEGIKNLIGTFYQPKAVYVDIDTLKTLDKRLFNEGLIESIKMAITLNNDFYNYLEDVILTNDNIVNNKLTEKENEIIKNIIIESLKIKKYVVEKDEKENDLRKVLNFGHTIGHGIEESSNNKLYHGECVAYGMLYMTNEDIKKRLLKIYDRLCIDMNVDFDKNLALEIITHDKKSESNYINVVLTNKIGTYSFEKWTIDDIKNIMKVNN